MRGEWQLVGRDQELRQLREILVVEHGSVVLAGPAGVGKTRLATEALLLAERTGLATARVAATRAAAGLPFGALAPLLPPVGPGPAGVADDRADLLRRFAGALAERGEGRRLVLLVDDAQLLDDASATLIHQMAASGVVSVVITVRTGEPVSDPIVALWKDGVAERLELTGLRVDAIGDVLSSALAGPVDPATITHLAVRCQGNMLFLRELVLGALADGSLTDEGGLWHLDGTLSPSERLIELVEARLAGLSPDERRLLELVSYGEPLGLAELMALGDPALAEGLERKTLLESRKDGRRLEIRLAHPLYGEVLRSRIPALRVLSMARSLADVVEAAGARRREDVLRVATWWLEGGGARPGLMSQAADLARWRYDFPLAERLARAAVEAGAGFEASLLAAQTAGLQGRVAEAEAELAALATRASNDTERATVALTRLDNHAFYLGRYDEGLRIAEEAEASITAPEERDEITARRSGLLLITQGPSAAAAAAVPLLDRARERALPWACQVATCALVRQGRLRDALETSDRGYAAHVALTRPLQWYPWVHLFWRCDALVQLGRLGEAEALAVAQYDKAVADGSIEARSWFAWQLVKSVGIRGHVEQAVRYGREAVALFQHLGRRPQLQLGLVGLATAQALAGRAGEAAETLATLDAMKLPDRSHAADLPQARAWTAVARGDIAEARCLLGEAADLGAAVGDRVGEVAALHALARLGQAAAVVDRLEDVASLIDGDLAPTRARHTRALATGDAQSMTELSVAFESMGADLLAAEAAADAAVAWLAGGEQRKSAAAQHRAGTLAERSEGPATPALAAIESRARLTPAEREAALLAASGLTNKEIADELFLSIRTVENRLQQVYRKLGVSSRSDLAGALGISSTGRT